MFKKILSAAAVTAVAFGVQWGATASAAPLLVPPSVSFTVHTHIANNGDTGGAGNVWAVAQIDRTLTVTTAAFQKPADNNAGLVDYSATIADKGVFTTVKGAATPNTAIPGLVILNAVPGALAGGGSFTFAAPLADVPAAANVASFVNDHGFKPASGENATSQWFLQAFTSAQQPAVGALVPAGGDLSAWGWKYSTGCENWADTSVNNDGQNAADGNITGVICKPALPTVPFVYAGHVLTGDQHNATVGWLDGIPNNQAAWGNNPLVNGHVNHCVEVFVYGFDRPAGTAHVGFTCDNGNPAANVGYLRGLEPGHTYALFVQPATGTYGNNAPIPGTNPQAHITVVTPA